MTGGPELWPEAGRQLREACKLLITPSPENLLRCADLLEGASRGLRPGNLPAADAAALQEMETLRRRVHYAGALLETAAEYHRKWTTLARSMSAGYAAGGQPGEYIAAGSLCLRG
jgi:hypothetical protein